jgi:hypothetical protein
LIETVPARLATTAAALAEAVVAASYAALVVVSKVTLTGESLR